MLSASRADFVTRTCHLKIKIRKWRAKTEFPKSKNPFIIKKKTRRETRKIEKIKKVNVWKNDKALEWKLEPVIKIEIERKISEKIIGKTK